MDYEFLINCADDFEAGLIMGALQDAGIATLKQYRGSGDYMKVIGGVGKDVDIYVPQSRLLEARQILETLEAEDRAMEEAGTKVEEEVEREQEE